MSNKSLVVGACLLSCLARIAAAEIVPNDEVGVVAYLSEKGVVIQSDQSGHATRLMSSGKTPLSAAEFQFIGRLKHLEQIGINAAPMADSEWGFLRSLPKLKSLSIWHGHYFATLEPFSKLPVESLTIGGCLGLRTLNESDPQKLRDVILTLHDLPNLKKLSLYHSPLAPDDSHLAHIAGHFGEIEDLRLDFASPRGMQTNISATGLAALQKLPLKSLTIENAHSFTEDHFHSIAGIKTLRSLLVDARKQAAPTEALAIFQRRRTDVEVIVSLPNDSARSQPKRK
jgi:hypothetical protein